MKNNLHNKISGSKIKNNISKLLVIAMIFTAVMGGFSDTAYGQMEISSIQDQISGANQYETAYQVAKANNPNPDTVVIVRGDKINGVPQVIDGLTASGIAGLENASTLLVEQNSIPSETKAALKDLNPKNVVIIGGPAAVSAKVHQEIYNLGITTKRVYGDNRYETAANVAKAMGTAKNDTAIIVDGNAVVDSLVAGPLAYNGYPILMVNNTRGDIPTATKSALKELGIEKVIIVGGTAVVSENIENQLNRLSGITVEKRFGGKNRVDTSLLLGAHLDYTKATSVSLINGVEYVDAVAASSLGAPVVYYNERHGMTEEIQQFIQSKGSVKLIGGTSIIQDAPAASQPETNAAQVIGSLENQYRSGYDQDSYLAIDIKSNQEMLIEGNSNSSNQFGWFQLRTADGKRVVSEFFDINRNGSYEARISLADAGISNQNRNQYEVLIFTAPERYTTYRSTYNGIMVQESASGLKFQRSLIYNDNMELFQKDNEVVAKDLDLSHLKPEDKITIENLAKEITKGITNEYDQVKAVHDWVAENIYYDYDGVRLNQRGRNDTMDTLNRRIAVCQGYAELTASLLRSIDIPTRMANGYALGASARNVSWSTADLSRSNHAWNEAYVDGRWIIMDATWNSTNRYENTKLTSGSIRSTYFDMSVEAFSITHKVFDRQRTIYFRY